MSKPTITRDELYQHFSVSHTNQQVEQALIELASSELDPTEDEFPVEIKEQVRIALAFMEQEFSENQSKNQSENHQTGLALSQPLPVSSFTKEELFQYFEDSYTPQQIEQALIELAKYTEGLDPEAVEFPVTITEKLDAVLKVASEAFKQQKQISGVQAENLDSALANAEKIAIQIANERALEVNSGIFRALVEIVAAQSISEAVALHQIGQVVRNQALADLNSKSLQEVQETTAARIEFLTSLLANPQKLDELLTSQGVSDSKKAEKQYQNVTNLQQPSEFNVDAFLEEVADTEKKSSLPEKISTIADVKLLSQNLLARFLR
jgi:hypothetical protein